MNSTELLLFPELASAVNPASDFASFRVDKKIIQIPLSFWKGGRIRADLSEFDAGEIVSRNKSNFIERVSRALQEKFGPVMVEILSEEFERDRSKRPARVRKKDLKAFAPELVYANPFTEDKSQFFGKYPDWLLQRHDLKWSEKVIYGRLLFPLPPICERWVKDLGVIIGLNQGELAEAVGADRTTVNRLLVSLQAKLWLKCDGRPGATQTTRFLWKDGMPEPFKYAGQPVTHTHSSCGARPHQPVTVRNSSCGTSPQVSLAVETNRETKRTKRRLLAPDGEQQLLAEIRLLLGEAEMKKNGGSWRARMRGSNAEVQVQALRNTIEDFKNRVSNTGDPIRDRPAWFVDRYRRNVVEIDEAKATKQL